MGRFSALRNACARSLRARGTANLTSVAKIPVSVPDARAPTDILNETPMRMFKELASLALLSAACTGVAHPQAYPAKPIRLVVPFAVGSSAELTFRPVAERASATLGQNIVLDSRPGG